MNTISIKKKLEKGLSVYIMDDFLGAAIRMTFDGAKTVSYVKYRGMKEKQVPTSEKVCFDVRLGGVEISKEQYELY